MGGLFWNAPSSKMPLYPMVAFPPARSSLRNRRRLVGILNKAAEDLAALGSEVSALRNAPHPKMPFSATALASLGRVAAGGCKKLDARLRALGAAPADGVPREPSGSLSGFIAAYRRCGRRLCLAQTEAREASDGATADLAFHLLRDLERHLWLLDAGQGVVPVETIATPGLFQFCSAG